MFDVNVVNAIDDDESLLNDPEVVSALESGVVGWDNHISKQIELHLEKVQCKTCSK